MSEEKKIIDSVDPVGIEGTKKIINQLINCICKIKIKDGSGTGFFLKFNFGKKEIKVLMTNYHILNETDLEANKEINLLLNDEKEVIILKIGIKRKIYFNKDYDITLIETKDDDNIKNYLELDEKLFKDNSEIIYLNKSIYILQYPNGKNACVSYGILSNLDKYNINHRCSTDKGSSGSPILNLESNKVIGIHLKDSNFNYNIGKLLKFPLKDFINKKLITKIEKTSIKFKNIEYKIIKELGKGLFGKVYQALNKSDNKYYVIEEFPIKEETKETIQSFQNEINILLKLNYNNIVKYYDASIDNKNIYILMEFCEGDNLRSFIDKNMNKNTLIEENIINIIIKQICIGIKEIHNKKLIHKDLKPENIIIKDDMDIKLIDLGLTKKLNIYKTYILGKNKSGSDCYTAPEILLNGIYHEKSDLWSLGCILYELFTLNIYYDDKIMNCIKKINPIMYNYKWQELIDSLLQPEYTKRPDINQINEFLEEKLQIKNINHQSPIPK